MRLLEATAWFIVLVISYQRREDVSMNFTVETDGSYQSVVRHEWMNRIHMLIPALLLILKLVGLLLGKD